MKFPSLISSRRAAHFEEAFALEPDLARALRATIAFISPLIFSTYSPHPHAAAFAAPAGLTLALADLRGSYRERFAIALTMGLAMTGATVLGVAVAESLPLSVAAMGAVALLGGLWRHLSADFGPALTSATALLFLLALGVPGGLPAAQPFLAPLALGCGLAILLQMGAWFTRPQHPLRAAVAEAWVAVADLLVALRPQSETVTPVEPASGYWNRLVKTGWLGRLRLEPLPKTLSDVPAQERALRSALDRAISTLAQAGNRRQSDLLAHLTTIRQSAARLGAWAEAFALALEPVAPRTPDERSSGQLPTAEVLLVALSTLARAVAVALISHRPRHFAAVAVRVQRCLHLAHVLDDKLVNLLETVVDEGDQAPAAARIAASDAVFIAQLNQLRALLSQLTTSLPSLRDELDASPEFAAGAASVLRRVPYLRALSPRSLTAWVDARPRLDPIIVRHALRMTVLTMGAVAVYKYFDLPRGYWIALTILVVLQPDYGATRQRAAQRIVGTLAGAVVASGLLWLPLPAGVLLALAALMALGFAYLVRKNYRWAVFFVTIMLVLITETSEKVTVALPLMRLSSTLAGGAVALLAALFLWPSWERRRFPVLLATALRANASYLSAVVSQVVAGRGLVGNAVQAKRAAETAIAEAGASLEKMLAEPASQHSADITQTGALLAYTQRLTRAITLLAVQLQPGRPEPDLNHPLREVTTAAGAALEALAAAIEQSTAFPVIPALVDPAGVLGRPAALTPQALALTIPLTKAVTEIRAMRLAVAAQQTPRAVSVS